MIALIWPVSCLFSNTANKHKPWLEPTYHGIVTENDDAVLLDPPLIALDKDAPLRFAGTGRPAPAPGAWALRGACSPVPGLLVSPSPSASRGRAVCLCLPCTTLSLLILIVGAPHRSLYLSLKSRIFNRMVPFLVFMRSGRQRAGQCISKGVSAQRARGWC